MDSIGEGAPWLRKTGFVPGLKARLLTEPGRLDNHTAGRNRLSGLRCDQLTYLSSRIREEFTRPWILRSRPTTPPGIANMHVISTKP